MPQIVKSVLSTFCWWAKPGGSVLATHCPVSQPMLHILAQAASEAGGLTPKAWETTSPRGSTVKQIQFARRSSLLRSSGTSEPKTAYLRHSARRSETLTTVPGLAHGTFFATLLLILIYETRAVTGMNDRFLFANLLREQPSLSFLCLAASNRTDSEIRRLQAERKIPSSKLTLEVICREWPFAQGLAWALDSKTVLSPSATPKSPQDIGNMLSVPGGAATPCAALAPARLARALL